MIDFNKPIFTGLEMTYIQQAVQSRKMCGDGQFTLKCNQWIEKSTSIRKALLTTSCTHALEMAAFLSGIHPGDEVILPSFTFTSTANAAVLAGAHLVFSDIRPDTMNIDEKRIEAAITKKTKAIIVVHYAGVACEMDTIMEIANHYNLRVIEDAAQAVMSTYKGKALGTIGDFGCFSFHESKNYSMGEGGALLIRDEESIENAEILREKGTDRGKFYRGQVDKYTWRSYGSSYLPSELNAAYLWAQLELADSINQDRLGSWNRYYQALKPLDESGTLVLPTIPSECVHNAHMFYIKTKDMNERTALIAHLRKRNISAVFHYVPLHSADAGRKYGHFAGEDRYTTSESERLLRLPMYYGLLSEEVDLVANAVIDFYTSKT